MIKFKNSWFDKRTGISYVRIQTDLGEFCGTAQLHKDDFEYASEFSGCSFAERRAIIKYIKEKIKIINLKISTIENLVKALKSYKKYDDKEFTNRKIRKYLYILKKEKALWNKRLKVYEEGLKSSIETKNKIIEERKKEDSND